MPATTQQAHAQLHLNYSEAMMVISQSPSIKALRKPLIVSIIRNFGPFWICCVCGGFIDGSYRTDSEVAFHLDPFPALY
jgi:hypothetical protein